MIQSVEMALSSLYANSDLIQGSWIRILMTCTIVNRKLGDCMEQMLCTESDIEWVELASAVAQRSSRH